MIVLVLSSYLVVFLGLLLSRFLYFLGSKSDLQRKCDVAIKLGCLVDFLYS